MEKGNAIFGNSRVNNVSTSAEQMAELEQRQLERHKRKLVGYLLSGGDMGYIFDADDRYSERHSTEREKRMAFGLISGYPEMCTKAEKQLLEKIASFPDGRSDAEIVERMGDDRHQKRILRYMVDEDWNGYNDASGSDVKRFTEMYPTPMDFDADATLFLRRFQRMNTESKYQEYVKSMDDFCKSIYGKKYEYYKAMKSLEKEAGEFGKERARGSKILTSMDGEKTKNHEKLVVDAAAFTFNKGNLIGNPSRKNEDTVYYNPDDGLFAVFDGAGGEKGAAAASGIALEKITEKNERDPLTTTESLRKLAEEINDAVYADEDAGYTTGVFGKIIDDEDGKRLAWVSVGDSRIYVVRNGKLKMITRDEGEENRLYNSLGREHARVRQFGDEPLRDGDRIVFCSDGITGDFKEDFIPDEEFARIVTEARTANDAAKALIKRATKRDDRTAVVVEV